MIDTTPTEVLAVLTVAALGIARVYAGRTLLSLRFLEFWGAARRLGMPVLDGYLKRAIGIGAENDALREEHVADVGADPFDLARAIDTVSDVRFEVSVLSGLKTDWDGNTEVASLVAYTGAKPFPGAPAWLRSEQIHIFLFRANGTTRVCAHREATSWRPDLWRDHLFKGPSFDVEAGVEAVRYWLTTVRDESVLDE